MKNNISIYWFRQDLRLADNPALTAAMASGRVLLIYILDDENSGKDAMGGASRWWLYYSLKSLNQSLEYKLHFYRGHPQHILEQLTSKFKVTSVYWNRCYEPWRMERDKKIKKWLTENESDVQSFNGSLLWEPWEIKKSDGTPYKVFTPFYRKGCLNATEPRKPLPRPSNYDLITDSSALLLEDLNLLPKVPWDKKIEPYWKIGETAAWNQLTAFVKKGLLGYKEGRNFPSKNHTSRLSPHLHFGEVSPNQIWHLVRSYPAHSDIDHFCSELGWREFSYHLLYQFPELSSKNFQPKFDRFPWEKKEDLLTSWKHGLTGYPIVDAGMRELWETGYMHNRVRMIVASFLVKNLLIDWRYGERWFWDCLVDADLANNSASWQWVAGSGADAAPYFRIFNPISQGEKFDPRGEYTRRFVPELSKMPQSYLFQPWLAPKNLLDEAGVRLGENYPFPIVDVARSRGLALNAFAALSSIG